MGIVQLYLWQSFFLLRIGEEGGGAVGWLSGILRIGNAGLFFFPYERQSCSRWDQFIGVDRAYKGICECGIVLAELGLCKRRIVLAVVEIDHIKLS